MSFLIWNEDDKTESSMSESRAMKQLALALLATCWLGACDSKDWEGAGFQDGYAATVNTTCKFRTTMVHGKFDNADYAKGYSRGSQAGAQAVATQGCERLK